MAVAGTLRKCGAIARLQNRLAVIFDERQRTLQHMDKFVCVAVPVAPAGPATGSRVAGPGPCGYAMTDRSQIPGALVPTSADGVHSNQTLSSQRKNQNSEERSECERIGGPSPALATAACRAARSAG